MDKREAVRVPVSVHARCRATSTPPSNPIPTADGSGGFTIEIEGLVEDISRSGMFLRAPNAIRPGSTAEIDLVLPNGDHLRLDVHVVRVEHSPIRAGMGLHISQPELPPETARSLANFIMRHHAAATT
jgi:hypothetical protein